MSTAVPIDPSKLLEAARDFADHHGGAGRPRPIWLRRAVSAAYYALFHTVVLETADHLLPNCAAADRLHVARSFGHGPVKEVCRFVTGRSSAPPQAATLVAGLRSTPIGDVAHALVDLQERRHAADYDHLAAFSKASVLNAIQDAADAIEKLRMASRRDREAFFTLLALKTGLR